MGESDRVEVEALERELTRALRRVDAPVGFADRVVNRASEPLAGSKPRGGVVLRWPERRQWMSGALAAGLAVGCIWGGVLHERHVEQERRVSQATAQFEAAERITDHALEQARQRVERAGVPLE